MWKMKSDSQPTVKRQARMKQLRQGRKFTRRLALWRRRLLQISSLTIAVIGLSGTGIWAIYQGHGDRLVSTLGGELDSRARSAGFAIQEVYVNGRRQASLADISGAVQVTRGDSILAFDPDLARTRLLELGWVKAAAVSRRLPNLVLIEIVEREPLALWQENGRLTLIGRDGVPITREGLGQFAKLPIVVGRGSRRHAEVLIRILATQPSIYPQVEAAVRIGDRRWNLRMKNGIEVNLPEEGAAKAWRKLAEIEAEHGVFKRDVAAIDLRFPDRLIVRLTDSGAQKRRNPGKDT